MSASASELASLPWPPLDSLTSLQPEIPPCGSALLDRDGHVVAVDGAWHRLHTLDAASGRLWALPGQLLLATCPDVSNASTQVVARSMAALQSGQCHRFEQTFRCHTQTGLRWFKVLAQQTDRADGAVLITQLEMTELELARARLTLQSTVARALTARVPLLTACRLLALALCEEMDWDFAGIWMLEFESWSLRCDDTWARPELGLQEFERLSREARLGPNVGLPGRVWANGQWLWFSNHMGPMRKGDSIVGAVIVSQDVTGSKMASEELLVKQRLAALGTLAAGVAHEINTPLQYINDSVHFLRESTREVFSLLEQLQHLPRLLGARADGEALAAVLAAATAAEEEADPAYLREQMPKAFDRCLHGLSQVATIVRSMKDFAHSAQHEMTPVDLTQAIVATLMLASSEYNDVAELETHFGSLPPVTCHVNEIKQVVLNIVVNAAHAIADKRSHSERGLIVVTTAREGDFAVISIGDNGDGIPEAVGRRVFEPFFTTKEVGRGTGQGLAIAWNVVKERHGGELTFETELGVGTTFHLRLPLEPRLPSDV